MAVIGLTTALQHNDSSSICLLIDLPSRGKLKSVCVCLFVKSFQSLCHPSLSLMRVILCWEKLKMMISQRAQCSSVTDNQQQHVCVSITSTELRTKLKHLHLFICQVLLYEETFLTILWLECCESNPWPRAIWATV